MEGFIGKNKDFIQNSLSGGEPVVIEVFFGPLW